MKKETDPKTENAVRIIQNVLIAVLFASVLVLSAACFIKMTASAKSETTNEPLDFTGISGDPGGETAIYRATELLPSVLALRNGAEHYAAYDGKTVGPVYDLAVRDIASVLSTAGASFVRTDEAEWTRAVGAEKYVCFRFRSPLPLSAVLDYAGLTSSLPADSIGCFASEMIIGCFGADATVLLKSPDGVYSAHGTVSSVGFGSMAEKMRESSAYPFDVMTDGKRTVLLTSGTVTADRCTVNRSASALTLGKQERAALLAAFGMNPDKVRTNEHTTGVTFVDVSGTIVADESVSYTAYQNGVSADIAFGSRPSLVGCIRASDKFISAVSDALGISLPETRLDSVTADGGTLTLKYLYCYDNIPLVADKDLGISVTLSENSITAFDMDIVILSQADGECILPDSHIVYGAYSKVTPEAVLPVLVAGSGSEIAYAEWRALAPHTGNIGGDGR